MLDTLFDFASTHLDYVPACYLPDLLYYAWNECHEQENMSLTATLAPIDEIISRTNEIIESSRSALDFSEKLSVRIQRLLGDDFSSANVLLVDTMNDLVRDSMQLRDTAIDESPDLMCHEPLTLYDLRTLPLMDFSPVRCLVDCKMTIMSINETFITDNRACIADRVFRLLIWKARGALRSTCRYALAYPRLSPL
jgi:hypothetical protein